MYKSYLHISEKSLLSKYSYLSNISLTSEPFLLPGKLTIRVLQRTPQTALQSLTLPSEDIASLRLLLYI